MASLPKKISSIRTRCVRETSSLSPKPFGRPKSRKNSVKPTRHLNSFVTVDFALLSTPSTWDFGHRFGPLPSPSSPHISSGTLEESFTLSPSIFRQNRPLNLCRAEDSPSSSSHRKNFVKSTMGWQPYSQRSPGGDLIAKFKKISSKQCVRDCARISQVGHISAERRRFLPQIREKFRQINPSPTAPHYRQNFPQKFREIRTRARSVREIPNLSPGNLQKKNPNPRPILTNPNTNEKFREIINSQE